MDAKSKRHCWLGDEVSGAFNILTTSFSVKLTGKALLDFGDSSNSDGSNFMKLFNTSQEKKPFIDDRDLFIEEGESPRSILSAK